MDKKWWVCFNERCRSGLFHSNRSAYPIKPVSVRLLCGSTIQGTLPKSRHFLFVSDAINAFLLLLEKGIVGEIYNVGTSCEIPIMQLARELVRMVGLGTVYSNI